jgi:serine phosphatase RsbU (regulator of sigma subunit)
MGAPSLADAMVAGAPVGMALFDLEHRFLRVNEAMAAMNRRSIDDHLGRRPADLNPVAEEMYGHLLDHVRDTGEAITAVPLSHEIAASGLERHWHASYYPVRDDHGDVVAIAAVVIEVSETVVSRRRSELLSGLARDLAGAITLDEIAESVTEFLSSAFRSRVMMGFVVEDSLVVHPASRGYDNNSSPIALEPGRPVTDVVLSGRPFASTSLEEYLQVYPHAAEVMTGPGDESSAWVPIRDPLAADRVLAVFRLGWSAPRALSDASIRLHETLASIIALAINRVQLSEARHRDRFRDALDAMLDHVTIARAVRGADGAIVDFEIVFASRASVDGAGRRSDDMVGRRVTELYPNWRSSGMFERFATVVETGEPVSEERLVYRDVTDDGRVIDGYWNLRVTRLGDGYIAASREVTAAVRADDEARRARSLAEQHRVAVDLLQRATLPAVLPTSSWFRVTADHRPAAGEQPIGGDWFDCFELDDDRVAIVIGDVAGHGTEAAALMVQARNITRAVAVDVDSPGEVLTKVNRVLMRAAPPASPFITCIYGIADATTSTFVWSRAGHPPPLLVRGADAPSFASGSVDLPLGVRDEACYASARTPWNVGDSILLYTDGLVERRGESIDVGLERLLGAVDRPESGRVDELVRRLIDTVIDPYDDIAVLGLTRLA